MTAPTLIGYQRPRIYHPPLSAVPDLCTIGDEIVDLAELAGLYLDDWEGWVLRESATVRQETFWNPYTDRMEHFWAAFEVGVMVSRQNGKGSIIEARELAGLFLLGERLIVHTAHQFDTSKEAFERIMMLVEDTPELDQHVMRVSRSHGEEGIEVRIKIFDEDGNWTGERRPKQRLRFRTRTAGGGRGFSGDCVILDEAMILGKEAVGALMPTLSARPNPQLMYFGSAGDKASTQFGHIRARGIKGGDPSLFYGEWSAELCTPFCTPDCTDHDRRDSHETYRKTNPGVGIRISVDHIDKERRSMPFEVFNRERLGVGQWPTEDDSWNVFDKDVWEARKDPNSMIAGNYALAFAVAPDRSWSAIAVAGINDDDMTHVEITGNEDKGLDHRPGCQWTIPRVIEICKKLRPKIIVVDKATPAGELLDELNTALKAEKMRIRIVHPDTRDFAQACGAFFSGIEPREGEVPTIVHIGQAPLTTAAATTETRKLNGMIAWTTETEGVDISPLNGATNAVWGFKKFVYGKSSKPMVAWR